MTTKVSLNLFLTFCVTIVCLAPAFGQKTAGGADAFTPLILRDAAGAAARMPTPTAKASAQFELARACLAVGDAAGATKAVKAAFSEFPKIRAADERNALLTRQAGAVAQTTRATPATQAGRADRFFLRQAMQQWAALLPAAFEGRAQVAEAQATADDLAGAWRTTEKIPDAAERNLAAFAVADARANRNDSKGAAETIQHLVGVGGGLTAAQNRTLGLAQTAARRGAAGDRQGAQKILLRLPLYAAQMPMGAKSANVLQIVGDARQSAGQTENARRTLADAFRLAAQAQPPAYAVLARIAESQAAQNDIESAARTLETLCPAPDAPAVTQNVVRRLIDFPAKRGDVSGALALLPRFATLLNADQAHGLEAELLIDAGRFAEARATALALQNNDQKAALLLRCAETQIETGELNSVRETLTAAATATDTLTDAARRDPNRERLARLQTRIGDIPGATLTAKSLTDKKSLTAAYGDILIEQLRATDYTGAQDTALGIADAALRDRMLVNIAAWQVKARNLGFRYRYFEEDFPLWSVGKTLKNADIPAAQQTSERIADPTARSAALSLIAQTQLSLNNREGALRTAGQIPDDTARGETLAAVASARLASGDAAGAETTAQEITTATGKAAFLTARARARAKNGSVTGAREDRKAAWRLVIGQVSLLRLAAMQAAAGEIGIALDTAGRYFAETQDREAFLQVWQAFLLRPRPSGEPLIPSFALISAGRDVYPRDETLRRASEWAAWRGDFAMASAVAARIADAPQRLSAYLTLANQNKAEAACARAAARAAALSLLDPDARFHALLTLVGRQ